MQIGYVFDSKGNKYGWLIKVTLWLVANSSFQLFVTKRYLIEIKFIHSTHSFLCQHSVFFHLHLNLQGNHCEVPFLQISRTLKKRNKIISPWLAEAPTSVRFRHPKVMITTFFEEEKEDPVDRYLRWQRSLVCFADFSPFLLLEGLVSLEQWKFQSAASHRSNKKVAPAISRPPPTEGFVWRTSLSLNLS